MRIVDSTISGVSSNTRLRFGMPALFTSTSMPPSSSDARARERGEPVEVGEVDGPRARLRRVDPAPFEHLVRAGRRGRAQMPTVAPRFANPSASAAPMPADAPVTNTCLPLKL